MIHVRRRTCPRGLLILLGVAGWLALEITFQLVSQHFMDSARCGDDVLRCLHQLTLGQAFSQLGLAWAAAAWIVVFAASLSSRRGRAEPTLESTQETNAGSPQRSGAGARRRRTVELGVIIALCALLLTLIQVGAALADNDQLAHRIGAFAFPLTWLVFLGAVVHAVVYVVVWRSGKGSSRMINTDA